MRKSKSKVIIFIAIIFSVIILVSAILYVLNKPQRIIGNKIAVIPIKGTISTENGNGDFFSGGTIGSGMIVDFIEKADRDHSVKAIILNINSPGGTVVASKEIADAVKKTNKPVVSYIREVGASGAYWIASASDIIVADPLSITGSIGVLGSYLEFSELFSKYGVKYQNIKTGEFKDLGSPYKELTNEEREVLMSKLRIIHEHFVDSVSENRGFDVNELSNGVFYLGVEAKEKGLIDVLGGKQEAIDAAKNLAGIESYELIFYQKERSVFDILNKLINNFGYSVGEGFGEKVLAKEDFKITL